MDRPQLHCPYRPPLGVPSLPAKTPLTRKAPIVSRWPWLLFQRPPIKRSASAPVGRPLMAYTVALRRSAIRRTLHRSQRFSLNTGQSRQKSSIPSRAILRPSGVSRLSNVKDLFATITVSFVFILAPLFLSRHTPV